jgi:hypothetical protein
MATGVSKTCPKKRNIYVIGQDCWKIRNPLNGRVKYPGMGLLKKKETGPDGTKHD